MSHFLTGVIIPKTDNVQAEIDRLLAPFDEGIAVPRYVKYTKAQLIAKEREAIAEYNKKVYAEYLKDPVAYAKDARNPQHIAYLQDEFPKKLSWTDAEVYEEGIKFYEEEEIGKNGEVYSTYNPKSKWDWYRIGGRWDGFISTDGQAMPSTENGFNFSDKHEQLQNNAVICAKLPRLENNVPFALVTPDGTWHERGDMGWWGMVKDEKDKEDWNATVWKILDTYPNHLIVGVDCHI